MGNYLEIRDIYQKLPKKLHEKMIQLFTTVRKNMRNRLINITDKVLQRKRTIIETINDQLKNISQIEYTRHRGSLNCLVTVLVGFAAYCVQSKKSSLNISKQEGSPILF